MHQPNKTTTPRRRSAERGARDAFVFFAMLLVVAALGLGLYMQFATSFWLALLVALTAYAALITIHALVRRGQVVAVLEAEIRELKDELEAASREASSSPVQLRDDQDMQLPQQRGPSPEAVARSLAELARPPQPSPPPPVRPPLSTATTTTAVAASAGPTPPMFAAASGPSSMDVAITEALLATERNMSERANTPAQTRSLPPPVPVLAPSMPMTPPTAMPVTASPAEGRPRDSIHAAPINPTAMRMDARTTIPSVAGLQTPLTATTSLNTPASPSTSIGRTDPTTGVAPAAAPSGVSMSPYWSLRPGERSDPILPLPAPPPPSVPPALPRDGLQARPEYSLTPALPATSASTPDRVATELKPESRPTSERVTISPPPALAQSSSSSLQTPPPVISGAAAPTIAAGLSTASKVVAKPMSAPASAASGKAQATSPPVLQTPAAPQKPVEPQKAPAPALGSQPVTVQQPKAATMVTTAAAVANSAVPVIPPSPLAAIAAVAAHPAAIARPALPSPIQPVIEPADSDLEAMQSLIQQLASQLSTPTERARATQEPRHASPMPSRPPSAAEASPVDDEVPACKGTSEKSELAQSVAALRQMASVMHRPADQVFATSVDDQGLSTSNLATHEATVSAEAGPSPYARLAVIAEAVAAERLDLYLDPILGLEDRKARHFEVSVRLRTDKDEALDHDGLAAVIAGTGLLARMDAVKLTRTAAVADRLAARGTAASLFANVQGESLADNGFLDTFADTFVDKHAVCTRLVLAFSQADVRGFSDVQWEAIGAMTELGFRFALEQVTDLDMDFELLKEHGFAFVKLDAAVFLDGMQAGDDMVPSADICRHLAELGLGLVVGGIVDEVDLAKIMGFGVAFGQGTLFGSPRSVQVEVKTRSAA